MITEQTTELTLEQLEAIFNDPKSADPVIYDDKEDRKKWRRLQCGKKFITMNEAEGEFTHYVSHCKQYRECASCRKWKEGQEKEKLLKLASKGQARYITVSTEDEKSITSQLGAYERLPNGTDKTTFIFTGNDDLGELVTTQNIDELSKLAVPPAGRRRSKKTGNGPMPKLRLQDEKEATEKEEDGTGYLDFLNEIEITTHDSILDFRTAINLDDGTIAPANFDELIAIVKAEYPLQYHPADAQQLQASVNALQDTLKIVCERYKIEFNFYRKTLHYLSIEDVNWKWLKRKLNLPVN